MPVGWAPGPDREQGRCPQPPLDPQLRLGGGFRPASAPQTPPLGAQLGATAAKPAFLSLSRNVSTCPCFLLWFRSSPSSLVSPVRHTELIADMETIGL